MYAPGHRGMVGGAIVLVLQAQHPDAIILTRTDTNLDLTDQFALRAFFSPYKTDQVYLVAERVGGIHTNNTYPADFIHDNLMIQANVEDVAFKNGVKRLLFSGSSCIYSREVAEPMPEDSLLTGELESNNEPFAIAKIDGIKFCESYNSMVNPTVWITVA